jgi:hypothetical protein
VTNSKRSGSSVKFSGFRNIQDASEAGIWSNRQALKLKLELQPKSARG